MDIARPRVFLQILGWLQLNHGQLSVLIHHQSGDDVKDHTERALWLEQPLKIHSKAFNNIDDGIPEFGVRRCKRILADDFDDHKTLIS